MEFEICIATDLGGLRKNNEDGFYVNDIGIYNTTEYFLYKKIKVPIFAFVADGVGGTRAGEEATGVCVKTALSSTIPYDDCEIIGFIDKVNQRVCELRMTIDTACTLAGILIGEDSIYSFNVGDSKVFSLSRGFLNQLSIDDTLSGLLGEITNDKEPLIQYTGKEGLLPHIKKVDKLSTFLICTDGLTDMLSLDDIELFFEKESDLKELTAKLVEQAKEKGGQDNITLIIIRPVKEGMGND